VPPVRCDLGGAAGWPGEEEEAGAARPRRSRTTSRPTPSRTSSLGSPTASPALLRGVSTPLSPTLSSFSAPARRVFSFFSRSVAADSADARRCWGATNSRGAWRRERERESAEFRRGFVWSRTVKRGLVAIAMRCYDGRRSSARRCQLRCGLQAINPSSTSGFCGGFARSA
jgi:hypothetical protein